MSDFIKSDYCQECGGDGYTWSHHENPAGDSEKKQCELCKELHQSELRFEILIDSMKGN